MQYESGIDILHDDSCHKPEMQGGRSNGYTSCWKARQKHSIEAIMCSKSVYRCATGRMMLGIHKPFTGK